MCDNFGTACVLRGAFLCIVAEIAEDTFALICDVKLAQLVNHVLEKYFKKKYYEHLISMTMVLVSLGV